MQPSGPIRIFDTTLRDGEQSPGCSMSAEEKLSVARMLERLRVDVIEAGFPAASDDEFAAVTAISENIRTPTIAALCRATEKDIERGFAAIRTAAKPRIHTFIATSDIHLEHKLRMSRTQVLERIGAMVAKAKSLTDDVEFSAEDASRSDPAYLAQAVVTAIDAGATTINLPDTVGYAQPDEYGALIQRICQLPQADGITVSVHCHNDLGLAVANSLTGIQNGARQVECTINGIGERAGNASLEEVVMNLRTRPTRFDASVNIDATQLYPASRLVSQVTGSHVQRNKAVVGANAFAHEAGIHQHGMLANRLTYEIMSPQDVGWSGESIVIGKHSGKAAIASAVQAAGVPLSEEELAQLVQKVKDLADRQKQVTAEEVVALAEDVHWAHQDDYFTVRDFVAVTGDKVPATATLTLQIGSDVVTASAHGIGIVDAAFSAMGQVLPGPIFLKEYALTAITGGANALASIRVVMEDASGKRVVARAVHEDIVRASLQALVNGYNRSLARQNQPTKVTHHA